MTQLDAALLALRDQVEAALQAFAPQRAPHVAMSLPFAPDGCPVPEPTGELSWPSPGCGWTRRAGTSRPPAPANPPAPARGSMPTCW